MALLSTLQKIQKSYYQNRHHTFQVHRATVEGLVIVVVVEEVQVVTLNITDGNHQGKEISSIHHNLLIQNHQVDHITPQSLKVVTKEEDSVLPHQRLNDMT